MENLRRFFTNLSVRRFSILLLISLLLLSIKDMLDLVLLTFLIAFIMTRVQQWLSKRLQGVIPVNSKLVVLLLYLALVTGLVLSCVHYLPKLFGQLKQIKDIMINLMNMPVPQDELSRYLYNMMKEFNLKTYVKQGFEYILRVSNWGTTFVLAIILSFFFILEKERVVNLAHRMKDSKISWLYEEMLYFGSKFLRSFGKVIEAQILIATCNTVFTMIALWIFGFPYLFALGIMVFLLSLIPIAGFLISLIPLSIIGYNIGGPMLVVYVITTIMILHFLEGYFLNPRLMSYKMNLPMFLTFIVLIFSEHYLGIWGLIIGIPIFVFLLDILEVQTDSQE